MWNIYGVCALVDQVKLLCHRPEREFASFKSLRERPDDALLVQRFTVQTPQIMEIPLHRLGRCRITAFLQRVFSGSDSGFEQQRRQLCSLKYCDNAFVCGTLSLAVAASCCLHNRIQSGQLPVYGGEIHVNAGFDQRCGDHAARLALLQARSYLLKKCLSLRGDHQSGEMVAALRRQQCKYALRCFTAVYDTERLRQRA